MKSSYSGFPEGLPIMLEPSGPNFAPHPKTYLTLDIHGMERGREKGTKAVIRNGEHRTYFA